MRTQNRVIVFTKGQMPTSLHADMKGVHKEFQNWLPYSNFKRWRMSGEVELCLVELSEDLSSLSRTHIKNQQQIKQLFFLQMKRRF